MDGDDDEDFVDVALANNRNSSGGNESGNGNGNGAGVRDVDFPLSGVGGDKCGSSAAPLPQAQGAQSDGVVESTGGGVEGDLGVNDDGVREEYDVKKGAKALPMRLVRPTRESVSPASPSLSFSFLAALSVFGFRWASAGRGGHGNP